MEERQGEEFREEIPEVQESAAAAEPRGGELGDREVSGHDDPRLGEGREVPVDSGPSLEDLAAQMRVRLSSPGRGPRTRRGQASSSRQHLSAQQRLLILDTWVRSKLPAREFADLFGLSPYTLYTWKKRFDEEGPAGLQTSPRGGPRGSRLSEATRRAILLMKSQHPEWGQDRLHAMIVRSEGLSASPGAIARVLSENGYTVVSEPTKPHPEKKERPYSSAPNELWQTDLFTFLLKRENRRVWMVVFLDDYSRFVAGYGVYASSSGALVREVLEASIANFGAPKAILTDNGPQYASWQGRSAFRELLDRRGIRQIVARPRHPQTLGKIERFWGSLWRELLQAAIFQGLEDARRRIGHFIDHYNFQRTHTGIEGLVPADRYFEAAQAVRETLRARVAANAADLARQGTPRKSIYLTGRFGEQTITLHTEGGRVVMTRADGTREEVDLAHMGPRAKPEEPAVMPEPVAVCGPASPDIGAEVEAGEGELAAPGTSPLDEALSDLTEGLTRGPGSGGSASRPSEQASGVGPQAEETPRTLEDKGEDGAAGVLVLR